MWAQPLDRIENEAVVIDHEEEGDLAGKVTVVIIRRMQNIVVIIVIYLDISEGNTSLKTVVSDVRNQNIKQKNVELLPQSL